MSTQRRAGKAPIPQIGAISWSDDLIWALLAELERDENYRVLSPLAALDRTLRWGYFHREPHLTGIIAPAIVHPNPYIDVDLYGSSLPSFAQDGWLLSPISFDLVPSACHPPLYPPGSLATPSPAH